MITRAATALTYLSMGKTSDALPVRPRTIPVPAIPR
jgi:hypothetical protein